MCVFSIFKLSLNFGNEVLRFMGKSWVVVAVLVYASYTLSITTKFKKKVSLFSRTERLYDCFI